ncbi:MAG: hypothetical protein Q8O72_09555 [Bacteroidales bacterium]|nr:hypothetical protein [Bacteroidales bacterium]
MLDNKEQRVIDFIKNVGESTSKEVFDQVDMSVSYVTLKENPV